MTGNFAVIIKKYSIPALFFIVGIMMVFFGMSRNQDSTFMLSSIMMFAAGAISVLYSSGKLRPAFVLIIGIVAGIAAAFTLYMAGKSVGDTNKYNKNYKMAKNLAVQNLQDIRYVQKVYAEKHGKYLKNWDDLVDYVRTGTVPYVDAKGLVPDTFLIKSEYDYLVGLGLEKKGEAFQDNKMSEVQAYYLSKWTEGPRYDQYFNGFKRDTIEVSLLDMKFRSKSYERSREIAGFPKFSADSLPYIPFTGARETWTMETADSVMMGDVAVPAIHVYGAIPFAKIQGTENEKLSFGKLTSNDTAGSWEDE